jgi:hypothetical protein
MSICDTQTTLTICEAVKVFHSSIATPTCTRTKYKTVILNKNSTGFTQHWDVAHTQGQPLHISSVSFLLHLYGSKQLRMVPLFHDCSWMCVTLIRARLLVRDFACEIKTLHNFLWFYDKRGFIKTRYIRHWSQRPRSLRRGSAAAGLKV